MPSKHRPRPQPKPKPPSGPRRPFKFCALPDQMPLQDRLCKWDRPDVRWTITGVVPGFSYEQLKAAYELAWSWWAEVCVLRPEYVGPTQQADVLMGAGVIDRPGQVLAWSEMPCGTTGPLRQMYDTSESWINSAEPGNKIDLVRVACHEIGHALGVPHIESGNLMAPTYSTRIRKPQPGDVREAVARYGQPTPSSPVPPSPAQQTITLVISGQVNNVTIPGWKVEKTT